VGALAALRTSERKVGVDADRDVQKMLHSAG
jgi:hypothetical protein